MVPNHACYRNTYSRYAVLLNPSWVHLSVREGGQRTAFAKLGCPSGVEPPSCGPQPHALPLSYGHNVNFSRLEVLARSTALTP